MNFKSLGWQSMSGERMVSMLWSNWQVMRSAEYPWHSVNMWRTVMSTPQKLHTGGLDFCNKKVGVSRVCHTQGRDIILWSWCDGWSFHGGVVVLMVLRKERPLLRRMKSRHGGVLWPHAVLLRPALASWSVFSFPWIPVWTGIQENVIWGEFGILQSCWMFGSRVVRDSRNVYRTTSVDYEHTHL